MTDLHAALVVAVADINALGARVAVIGGLAVSTWTEPRFTRDADLVVAVGTDTEAESIVHGMVQRGYRLGMVIEHKAAGRLSTARLAPPGAEEGGIIVDLLFSSSGIESELVEAAQVVDIGGGLPVPVARPGHLVALKLLSTSDQRPQDRLDLVALRDVLNEAELALAREGVRLIVARGYARGRDLVAALDELIAR